MISCLKLYLWLLVSSLSLTASLVTVLQSSQIYYDRSPKIRIKGSGFNVEDRNVYLDIATNIGTLTKNKDYMINMDGDGEGVILKLLSNRM